MGTDGTEGIVVRDRPGFDEVRARIETLREASRLWRDIGVDQEWTNRDAAVFGTDAEMAAAVEVLQRSLAVAIDRVGEADIAVARERGWLTADEAAAALTEKRLRELARVGGRTDPEERQR